MCTYNDMCMCTHDDVCVYVQTEWDDMSELVWDIYFWIGEESTVMITGVHV